MLRRRRGRCATRPPDDPVVAVRLSKPAAVATSKWCKAMPSLWFWAAMGHEQSSKTGEHALMNSHLHQRRSGWDVISSIRSTRCAREGAGIVLVALEVGLHILRRRQPHLVAELRQLARPIMRGGTRLHPDQARRKSREKRYHLAAPKLLPHHDLLVGVDAVPRRSALPSRRRCWPPPTR